MAGSPYAKHARSPHSPSPIYGIRPGFTVGDLEAARLTPLHVYGTYSSPGSDSIGLPTFTWNTQTGRWDVIDALLTQATTSDSSGTVVSPNARAVKIGANVTGTGNVTITVKSAIDSYSSTLATYVLTKGNYELYLGGWATASSDGTSYDVTQYGPNGADSEAESGLSPATDNNYVGQTYNPFQFLSLDGYSLKFFTTVSGSVGYDVNVTAIS